MDGNMQSLAVQNNDKEPQNIILSTPQELWDFLKKLEEEKNK
jgi:hypothetical protein